MIQTQRTLLSVLFILFVVVLAHLLEQAQFGRSNVVMVYMLAVVVVAVQMGLWPAVLTSLLGVPLFHYFDVPPYFQLDASELEHTFSLGVMLATALIVSSVASRLRQQALVSEERANQNAALYALASELAEELPDAEVLALTARHVARAFRLPAVPPHATVDAIRAAVPGGHADSHLDAMLRLAAQALERSRLRERLRGSERRAQQEALRSSVLGAVSHDLRTPLASIIGASSSLVDSGEAYAPDVRGRLGRVIHEEALQMKRMVENLLDFARLRSSQQEVQADWQALEEMVGSALATIRRRTRDHRLVVDVPAELPLLRCNGVLIERVLTNLVENAVKFSPPGSTVTLRARRCGDQLELRVLDEGAGIEPARRESIFEPFTRFGSQEGSGLGLAICRGIVEAHGGSVVAEDAEGGGACFVLRLPIGGEPPALPSGDDNDRGIE